MAKLSDDYFDRMFELLMRQDQEDAEGILNRIADAANRKKAAEAEAEKKRLAARKDYHKEEELVELILASDKWMQDYYGDKLGSADPMTESAAAGVAKVLIKLMDSGYYFGLN